jgi:uncharacterized membrane protein
MNIFNFLNFFFADKWSVNGALGIVFTFISLNTVQTFVTVCTAFVGLGVATLSFYKLFLQVRREHKQLEKDFLEANNEKE